MIRIQMIRNKKLLLLFGPSFICSSIFSSDASAGAWTQPKGHGQLILTALHYSADERFDVDGTEVSQARYSKQELNPYLEYGLTDRVTLGGSTFLQHLDDSSDSSSGIGDTELFARWGFYRSERFAFSIQPEIKLPSPQADSGSPTIGSEHIDYGGRVMGGMNFSWWGRKHFAEMQLGYRHRSGEPADQVLCATTLGLNITERITVLSQGFGVVSNTGAGSTFTQSPRDDYSLGKTQLSALYRLNNQQTVQLGVFAHMDGRNTAKGGGVILGWWRNF